MKKILVTGGAGFIGANLCESLLTDGNEVLCIDNLNTGQLKNIDLLKSYQNFKFVNHNIIHPYNSDFDEIYNLACPASPVHYQKDPIYTIQTSYLGTLNMLDNATENNSIILQASTSEIYGDPKVHPQHENYWGNVNPIGIRSCYDEGKRIAETLCFDYNRKYKTKIKIVRIFNTYGPRMRKDDGRVVSNFIVQSLKGKDLTVFGDGSQTRSFQYIDDLILGLKKMMNSKNNLTGPLNLGNNQEYSVLFLAKKILDMTNSKSKIKFYDLPSDDPIMRKPDISLAKKEIDWEPKIELEDGLTRTIEYFDNIL